MMIAYFSWANNAEEYNLEDIGIDVLGHASVVVPGDVGRIARYIEERTGAEMFPIILTEKYSGNYNECLEQAKDQRGQDEIPELTEHIDELGYQNADSAGAESAVVEEGAIPMEGQTGAGQIPEELAQIPKDYFQPASEQRRVERLDYQTYESMSYEERTTQLTKTAYVYLPYGYSEETKYNVLYLMHGGFCLCGILGSDPVDVRCRGRYFY